MLTNSEKTLEISDFFDEKPEPDFLVDFSKPELSSRATRNQNSIQKLFPDIDNITSCDEISSSEDIRERYLAELPDEKPKKKRTVVKPISPRKKCRLTIDISVERGSQDSVSYIPSDYEGDFVDEYKSSINNTESSDDELLNKENIRFPSRPSKMNENDDIQKSSDLKTLQNWSESDWVTLMEFKNRNLSTIESDVEISTEIAKIIRKTLLSRLSERSLPKELVGLQVQFETLRRLIHQTVHRGESNTILLVGSHGSGKTTAVRMVLDEIEKKRVSNETFEEIQKPFILINLNGKLQNTEMLAVKEIAQQLRIEAQLQDIMKIGSSAERGNDGNTSVIFILEEFDQFVSNSGHPNQKLLYNLFDLAQSHGNPIAVIGLTTHVVSLESCENCLMKSYSNWQFREFSTLQEVYEELFKFAYENYFLEMLPVSQISQQCPIITVENISQAIKLQNHNYKSEMLQALSLLELSLVLAIRNLIVLREIDNFNFLMVYTEYEEYIQRSEAVGRGSAIAGIGIAEGSTVSENGRISITGKAAGLSSSSRNLFFKKPVTLKAFEQLIVYEIIKPIESFGKGPKEFRMFRCMIDPRYIETSVKKMIEIPSILKRWASTGK
ncbi:origin recognition complex subunit 4 [Nowakowskiella sp. JEL0078]|nr:origin recognition complex subunit 4 [Nowakowskiella sp. JEL0078]